MGYWEKWNIEKMLSKVEGWKKNIKREWSYNEGGALSIEAGVKTFCTQYFSFLNIYKNEKYITLTQTS